MNNSVSTKHSTKKNTSVRWQVLSLSIFVFLLAQGFSTLLGILSYQQSLTTSVLSSNLVIASSFQHKLERALRFGKDINNFYGIDKLMENIQQGNDNFKRIEVYSPDGDTLYSTSNSISNGFASSVFPPGLLINFKKQQAIETRAGYALLYPVKDRKGTQVATASVFLDSKVIKEELKGVVTDALEKMFIIIVCAIFIIIIAINNFIQIDPSRDFPKKQLFLLLFSVMITGQLVHSALSAHALRNEYINIVHLEASAVTEQVKDDIEKALKKGTSLEKLHKDDLILKSVLDSAELIKTITITNSQGEPLSSLSREEPITMPSPLTMAVGWLESFYSGFRYEQTLPLINEKESNKSVEGYIRTTLSSEYIHNKLKEFLLDSITVLLVALLLITEIMLFLQAFFQYHDNTAETENLSREGHAFVRTVTSMFLFGFMMSVSFVPLHINNLLGAEGLWGLSTEVIQSLPLSFELFCALGSVLLSGYWLDRRGWHEPFIIGILICSVGTLISGWSTTPLIYILGRGLAGFGYGFTWMSAQGYILSAPDVKDRTSALSSLIAGIFIGFICGNAVGAMLADRLGFAAVFQLSTIFLVLPLVFMIIFMRRHYRKGAVVIDQGEAINWHELFSFLKDRRVLATLFFSVIPRSLCQLGLIQFIVPVYFFSIGVSQADIGRAIMIYGLMLVYIAPIMSKYLDRSEKHRLFIILGGFVGGIGLIQVYFFSGYISILIAIMLMGLAACFMVSAQSIFILELAQSSNVSPGIAVSIQRTVTKLGHVMGPLVFSALLVTYQMEKGLMIMGIYFALTTVAFLLFTVGQADTTIQES